VILAGPLGIERQLKLLVPVEGVASAAQFIVTIAGTRTVTGDISSVSSDLVGDQTFTYVFRIGQTQVLLT